jgi:YD repeat-containing protein
MKKFFIPLLFVFPPFFSLAQFQNGVPLVKPIPPDAAALFKVLERPLGTYTGTVPISFPMCSLKSGTLSADIALNYNSTGGIRVEECASSVGLGFSLSDGAGRITQIIRGNPDDYGLITNYSTTNPSNWNCSNMNQVQNYTTGTLDLEPDEFMYNLNGRSGKFFFKQDGTIVLKENSGLKIEKVFSTPPANPGIKQWIITDEQGNKYYFGYNKAGTVNYRIINMSRWSGSSGSTQNDSPTSVTWYLTEAYDMNEENRMQYSYVSTGSVFTTFSGAYWPINTSFYECTFFNTTPDLGANVTTSADEYLVSRIDTRNGYLLFNSSTDRLDGVSRKLNTIQLYDIAGNYKKQYRFNYGYFSEPSPSIRRLKLISFSELPATGTDSLTHKFEYEELQNLPARLSTSVDLWGFYNGVYNSYFLPNIIYRNSLFSFRTNSFANRNSNGEYAQANILKKITYPTGGYRQFIYEGNTVLMSLNLEQYHPDPDYSATRSFTRTDFTNILDPYPSLRQHFTVNSVDGETSFIYSFSGVGVNCSGYYAKLFKTTTDGDPTGGIEMNLSLSGQIYIPNGYYRFEVYKTSPACTIASVTGSWYEATFNMATIITPNGTSFTRNNRKAGGVRIKEIRDYDPVSNKLNVTEYKYKLYGVDSNFTSGRLVSEINMVGQANSQECGCGIPILVPQSSYPLAAQDGSYVVYPQVRTIENGNGWVDQEFGFVADYPASGYPSVPSQDNSILRGQLLEQRFYDKNSVLLKKTNSSYGYTPSQSQAGIVAKAYYPRFISAYTLWSDIPNSSNEMPFMAACKTYYQTGQGRVLASTIDSTFTPSGNFAVRKDYNYTPYGSYYALKNEIVTLNNNQVKQTTYRYPFTPNTEFTFGLTTAEQTMKSTLLSRNFLQPIEVVDSLKSATRFMNGTKYSFNTFNSNIRLAQTRSYPSPTSYIETNLSNYDIKGNLTEQYKTNDIKEVYLWGYDYNYPVAKVVGSSYAAIAAIVNNTLIQNLATSDAAMRTELHKIRTSLAGTQAEVTTYTYNPFIGMTSATDPNGKTIFYEYDSFGRLKVAKDKDGKVLKIYDYQYQQPVTQ